jgi:hypothetical protein
MPATLHPAPQGVDFYRHALEILDDSGIEYLLGGAFATGTYTGVERDTKDLDCMLRRRDVDATLKAFRDRGFKAEYAFPHWLAKVYHGEHFIDLIYCAGNGLCPVDDQWFANSRKARVLGREVTICPPEEIIWQKAYIMERERFDGADINHLFRSVGKKLDWKRLLSRFGEDWRVLYAHMVIFGFVYPGERDKIPEDVMAEMAQRLAVEGAKPIRDDKVCKGSLLSRAQYLPDIEHWGYQDARLQGLRKITETELEAWTAGIDPHQRPV